MNKILINYNKILNSPGTGPQTLGIISKIAEHDGSSKHSWRANIQFSIAIAIFTLGPVSKENMKENRLNWLY